MADIKGSERNPICIDEPVPKRRLPPLRLSLLDDDETPVVMPDPEYYSLVDGDVPLRLPAKEIPATRRELHREKSNRQNINVPRSNASVHRRASPQNRPLSRAPSAKNVNCRETMNPPDDEAEPRHRSTPRRGAITHSFGHDRATTPSASTTDDASSVTHVGRAPRSHSLASLTPETRAVASDTLIGGTSRHMSDDSAFIETRLGNARTQADANDTIVAAQSNKLPLPGLSLYRPLNYHISRISHITTRENNATQLETVGEGLGSTESASGSRADAQREQTNTRRVGSDAITSPMHGQHDSEPRSASRRPVSLEKGSHRRNLIKRSKRPRAVKSAEQRRPEIGRTPQLFGNSDAQPSSSVPLSNSETHSERPSAAHLLLSHYKTSPSGPGPSEEDIAATEDASERQQVAPPTANEASSLADAGSIEMGAQVSTLSSVATILEQPSANSVNATPIDQNDAVVSDALEDHVTHINGTSLEHPDDANHQNYTNNSKVDQLEDIDAARCRVEASLRCHLDDRYEDHAYLVKNTMWRQRTCYERDLRPHTDDTTVQWDTSPRLKFEQSKSPFGKMQDIQSMLAKSNVPNTKEMGQEIFAKATSKGSTTKTTSSVPAITYVPEKLQIPPFKEYVSLKTNILADNESKILTLPYLGDNEPEHRQQVLRNDLPTRYEILHDENALLDLRSEQCHYYYDTIEAFLGDLGLKWDTMIYWLLSSATDLRHKNRISEGHAEFEEILQDRAPYDKEFFCRDGNNLEATLFESGSDHWRNLLTQLQEPSVGNLRLIAIAGAAIMRHCSFSPWYMVKRCKTMQGYVHAKLERAKDVPDFTFRDILCRICHEHDCVFHGQIREDPKGGSLPDMHRSPSPSDTSQDHAHEDESDVEIAHYDTDNSDVEKVINYKLPVNSGPPDDNTQSAFSAPRHPVPPAGPFRPKWWECNTETSWEKCKPFVPCSHHGSCVEAKCRCFRENITCEKTCKCSLTCNRRFPGCKCAQVPNKRTCSTATGCLCVKFERECDADLCGTCGATEVLDPLNRYDEEVLQDRCKNVAVQRGVSKKTLLGKSEVHGFGLYAGEDIYKGEHIGEYVGEIISSSESQRRGIVYHYEKNMYLFQLNEEQEVDATHMGNKLRFINNANKNLSNCSCRVVFCNTVFRVALNANSDIKAGTELFFHYNYPEDMTKHFKQPKSKVVAVKQVVKLNSKDKTNTASSRSSSNNDSYRPAVDNPRMLAATAKARAAKKAKREAMLAEQGLGAALFKNASRSSKPARKSAGYSSLLPTSREWSARGRPRKARGAASRDESAASGSVADYSRGVSARRRRSATLVVQETDDEDDEFRLGSTQGEDDDVAKPNAEDSGHDSQAVTGAQDATTQSSSRLRTRATVPASVMAVKQVKKKKGGARPGAGRKRKRPLIVNSDDEL